MPAQHQNGVHKACGDGVLENTYDDTFLFTSESVGEGHPGKFPFNLGHPETDYKRDWEPIQVG